MAEKISDGFVSEILSIYKDSHKSIYFEQHEKAHQITSGRFFNGVQFTLLRLFGAPSSLAVNLACSAGMQLLRLCSGESLRVN